jgi:hypothetical protein
MSPGPTAAAYGSVLSRNQSSGSSGAMASVNGNTSTDRCSRSITGKSTGIGRMRPRCPGFTRLDPVDHLGTMHLQTQIPGLAAADVGGDERIPAGGWYLTDRFLGIPIRGRWGRLRHRIPPAVLASSHHGQSARSSAGRTCNAAAVRRYCGSRTRVTASTTNAEEPQGPSAFCSVALDGLCSVAMATDRAVVRSDGPAQGSMAAARRSRKSPSAAMMACR